MTTMNSRDLENPGARAQGRAFYALPAAAFVAGLCSIVYELLIATTVSYFLGDSVRYFSITIGLYLAATGLGSLFSKYVHGGLARRFVVVELGLAAAGGLSVPALYLAYSAGGLFLPVYIFFTLAVGFLIGLEIPFLTRLMERFRQLRVNIADILSLDYFGALAATMAFPFVLLPFVGLYRSSIIFGLVNMSIGFLMLGAFKAEIGRAFGLLRGVTVGLTVFLAAAFFFSAAALSKWDQSLYDDRIVLSVQSPYQKIVLTKYRDDLRLYLDGNLQFSSIDEYRYHESLVHLPMALSHIPVRRALLLGAGDGLAARELLKYEGVEEIVLVDLDKEMIALARENPHVAALNEGSLHSPRVSVVIGDAFGYLEKNEEPFDFIIADLPDPNNNALARLYSRQFYQLARRNLGPGGFMVTQATSPYFARQAFWCVAATVEAAGFTDVHPYHANVPSFGEWGFVLASEARLNRDRFDLKVPARYLTPEVLAQAFVFPRDIGPLETEINLMDKPALLDYYLKGWRYYR